MGVRLKRLHYELKWHLYSINLINIIYSQAQLKDFIAIFGNCKIEMI